MKKKNAPKDENCSGAVLRRRMARAGLKIGELAFLTGVPERTLYSWMAVAGPCHPAHKSALRILRMIEKRPASTIALLEEIANEEAEET
jgi:predicted transcriptional regulator